MGNVHILVPFFSKARSPLLSHSFSGAVLNQWKSIQPFCLIKQVKIKPERPGRGMSRCIPYNNIIFSIEVRNLFIKQSMVSSQPRKKYKRRCIQTQNTWPIVNCSARSLICTFLQQIHLRNFHFSQLHNLKNFNYFHIGFLYQIHSATSHPVFDHRGLSIDTPSISYL